ncbi:MAG: hypothetical protein COV66_11245, partial [Nitrospinae bacterium CG11_big_fil_rev_8_21_14_0_20_45_15]
MTREEGRIPKLAKTPLVWVRNEWYKFGFYDFVALRRVRAGNFGFFKRQQMSLRREFIVEARLDETFEIFVV